MKGAMDGQGRVRWRRFAAIFVPATAAAVLLLYATVQGAIGVTFAVAGRKIKVSADKVRAWAPTEFGGVVETKEGKPIPVLVTTTRRTELFNLCQSYLFSTPLGDSTIKLTGGTDGRPVVAENQVVDALVLRQEPRYTNIQIGRDASTLDTPPGAEGRPGEVSQFASMAVSTNLRQIQLAVSATSIVIPNSLVRVLPGDQGCF
jgi:hypothetical protein